MFDAHSKRSDLTLESLRNMSRIAKIPLDKVLKQFHLAVFKRKGVEYVMVE
jgi:hypothetical protein